MFDKLQELKKLRDMQSAMKQERVEAEKSGVRIVMNGGLEIEELSLNPDLAREEQERVVKEVFTEVMQKAQRTIAQKFAGGF